MLLTCLTLLFAPASLWPWRDRVGLSELALFDALAAALAAALAEPRTGPMFQFALVLDPHIPYEPSPESRFGERASSRTLVMAWQEGRMWVPMSGWPATSTWRPRCWRRPA